jgi:hypothetical protein
MEVVEERVRCTAKGQKLGRAGHCPARTVKKALAKKGKDVRTDCKTCGIRDCFFTILWRIPRLYEALRTG